MQAYDCFLDFYYHDEKQTIKTDFFHIEGRKNFLTLVSIVNQKVNEIAKIRWDNTHNLAKIKILEDKIFSIKLEKKLLSFLFDNLGFCEIEVKSENQTCKKIKALDYAKKNHFARKQIKVVALALIDENKKVLMSKRGKQKNMSGLWEFAGGKIKKYETKKQALIREIKEEIDINLKKQDLKKIAKIKHKYENFTLEMDLFLAKEFEGKIKAKEHKELKWFNVSDIKNIPVPCADYPLISKLESFILN